MKKQESASADWHPDHITRSIYFDHHIFSSNTLNHYVNPLQLIHSTFRVGDEVNLGV